VGIEHATYSRPCPDDEESGSDYLLMLSDERQPSPSRYLGQNEYGSQNQ
jgi:hypothetical protein